MFKPTAPLSGGLLWKIPWRLSPPQKLRQRRRLRRVDNVVAVLDEALKRQLGSAAATTQQQTTNKLKRLPEHANATPEELSTTAEFRRLPHSTTIPIEQMRHGRGPRQGELLPGKATPSGLPIRLGDHAREQGTIKLIERWKLEMPREEEMLPKDKYTIFDRKERSYRKGVHKLPKWTRVSQRVNPPGF